MKVVYKKKNLYFFTRFVEKKAQADDYWTMAQSYLTEDGYTCNTPTLILLLTKGAEAGNVQCMCQLGRQYALQGVDGLPLALHWWSKALAAGNMTAYRHIKQRDILSMIHNYKGTGTAYSTIELQCAMLASWILTRLNLDDWNFLTNTDKTQRIEKLIREAAVILHVSVPKLLIKKDCRYKGEQLLGFADEDGELWLAEELLQNLPLLVEVVFHELGHFVTYSMWHEDKPEQRERFGVTKARVQKWADPFGRSFELDANTLGYGVYSIWILFFS